MYGSKYSRGGSKYSAYNRRRLANKKRRVTTLYRKPASFYSRTKRTPFKRTGNFQGQRFVMLASTQIIPNGSSLSYYYSPSIGNIPAADLTAYQNLYDEYRIVKIGLKICPKSNVNTTDLNPFYIYSVLDKTDTSAITVSQALEYNNCYRTLSVRPVYRQMIPNIPCLMTASNSGTTFNMSTGRHWIELDNSSHHNTDVEHLGIKVVSDVNDGHADQEFDVYEYLWVQFRVKK